MNLERDQARHMAAIEPLLLGLHAVFDEAMTKYMGDGYSKEVRAEHSERTVANIIYDHADKAWRRFEDEIPGCTFRNSRGMHLLIYKDLAVIRLKQVDARGRHANVQTDQQQDFDDDIDITGLPEMAVRLYAGYQMDGVGLGIERIMIVRQLGRDILWTAQVNVAEEAATWTNVTQPRFEDMGRTDFDVARARRARRSRG